MTNFQHVWKRPNEELVDRALGGNQLEQMMLHSMGMTIPIPILCMPQVQVYRGMLVPVVMGGGFSSLGDLISEATTGGKRQDLTFQKTGVTGVANATNTLWLGTGFPGAGAAGAALAAGTNTTSATAGAIGFTNAAGGDTLHLVSAWAMPSIALNTLFLFDRIWHGAPALSSNAAQTVTMTAARYAGTGAGGTSIGNFASVEIITTNMGATGHTWLFNYKDDQNNSSEAIAAITGLNTGISGRLDIVAATPFAAALNGSDLGISNLVSFTWSTASLTTGGPNLVLGHPLGYIPQPIANQMIVIDGINSAFNLARIYDSACLSLWELWKNAVTATTYQGQLTVVSG